MVGLRTRLSLGQLLDRFEPSITSTLLSKHAGFDIILPHGTAFAPELFAAMRTLDSRAIMSLLAEVIAAQGEMRQRLKPHYVFDDRFFVTLRNACASMATMSPPIARYCVSTLRWLRHLPWKMIL